MHVIIYNFLKIWNLQSEGPFYDSLFILFQHLINITSKQTKPNDGS